MSFIRKLENPVFFVTLKEPYLVIGKMANPT